MSAIPQLEPDAREASAPQPKRKETLPALTGLRCFAAIDIVFFHFSNPKWFGPFAPIVNNGYTAVSFFLLMSGYILAYNYSDRAHKGQLKTSTFWIARFSRLYPVYLLALVVSFGMLMTEWHVRSHGQFLWGLVLTPLMLQGWHPWLSTFWNTPAWTMCVEAFFYLIFPVVILWKRPRRAGSLILLLLGLWALAMVLPGLYMWFHPDGVLHPNRFTEGFWIRVVKFTPPPHVPAFLFGIALADLDALIPRASRQRLLYAVLGLGGCYAILYYGDKMPYPMMHDGLMMPLFGLAILGLASRNILARIFSFSPLVIAGEASYSLYILHFNLWNMIHHAHLWQRLHVAQFDPWLSYAVLVAIAIAVTYWFERPCQKWIRGLVRA